jgi:hypothetical protein
MVDPVEKGLDSIEQADVWMAEAATLLVQLEYDLNVMQERRENASTRRGRDA